MIQRPTGSGQLEIKFYDNKGVASSWDYQADFPNKVHFLQTVDVVCP